MTSRRHITRLRIPTPPVGVRIAEGVLGIGAAEERVARQEAAIAAAENAASGQQEALGTMFEWSSTGLCLDPANSSVIDIEANHLHTGLHADALSQQ